MRFVAFIRQLLTFTAMIRRHLIFSFCRIQPRRSPKSRGKAADAPIDFGIMRTWKRMVGKRKMKLFFRRFKAAGRLGGSDDDYV